MEINWNFRRGGGANQKTSVGVGGVDIFLLPQNSNYNNKFQITGHNISAVSIMILGIFTKSYIIMLFVGTLMAGHLLGNQICLRQYGEDIVNLNC